MLFYDLRKIFQKKKKRKKNANRNQFDSIVQRDKTKRRSNKKKHAQYKKIVR